MQLLLPSINFYCTWYWSLINIIVDVGSRKKQSRFFCHHRIFSCHRKLSGNVQVFPPNDARHDTMNELAFSSCCTLHSWAFPCAIKRVFYGCEFSACKQCFIISSESSCGSELSGWQKTLARMLEGSLSTAQWKFAWKFNEIEIKLNAILMITQSASSCLFFPCFIASSLFRRSRGVFYGFAQFLPIWNPLNSRQCIVPWT